MTPTQNLLAETIRTAEPDQLALPRQQHHVSSPWAPVSDFSSSG